MASGALVALWLLLDSIRGARAAGDLDASTALTLGMGWLFSLPIALVAIFGGFARRPDAFRQLTVVLPGWYETALQATTVLLAALAAVLLLNRLTSERVPVHTAGLLAIVLWAVAQLASGLSGEALLSLRGGALLVCLLAATVLPRGRGACLGAGIFGVTLAIASGLLAVFRYDVAFVVDCQNQCSVLGSALVGVLPNENLLGIALAAAIPFAYLGFRGRARTWFPLYLAAMAVATGSRTAALAAVITVVALLVVRPRLDAERGTPARAAIAGLLLAGAVFSSVYVTQRDWDPSALTGRPALWQVASDYVGDSPVLGYGPEKWAGLYGSSEIPRDAARSAHNQWMDVLFAAGWVGAALLVSVLLAVLWTSGYARPGALIALAAIVMIGTTEGAWSIGAIDFMSFSFVALILMGPTRGGATSMAKESAAGSYRPVRASAQPATSLP
jgi:O-antigen ligase